jgi:hypothetical protein
MTSPGDMRGDAAAVRSLDRTDEARIGNAECALATLDTKVRGIVHASALCDAALRRAAILTSGAPVSSGALRNLLLFEATALAPFGSCGARESAHDPAVAHAARCVDALVAGSRRFNADGTLTSGVVLAVLAALVDGTCNGLAGVSVDSTRGSHDHGSPIPSGAAAAIEELCAALRCATAPRSIIARAALVQRRLAEIGAEIGTEMDVRGPMSRIGALVLLRAHARPFLSPDSSSRIGSEGARDAGGTPGNRCDETTARFADAIATSVASALPRLERIAALTIDDDQRIGALSQAAHSARRVHVALQRRPVISLPQLLDDTGLRVQAATSALHRLRGLGIVREITGRYRHRLYSYDPYVDLLGEDA